MKSANTKKVALADAIPPCVPNSWKVSYVPDREVAAHVGRILTLAGIHHTCAPARGTDTSVAIFVKAGDQQAALNALAKPGPIYGWVEGAFDNILFNEDSF